MYFDKSQFTSYTLYNSYKAFLLIRLLIVLLIGLFLFVKHIIIRKPLDLNSQYARNRIIDGLFFYLTLPIIMWFGHLRLYSVKDFLNLLMINYIVEFFYQSLPLTIIAQTTNASLIY
jgi:hypothetical protein